MPRGILSNKQRIDNLYGLFTWFVLGGSELYRVSKLRSGHILRSSRINLVLRVSRKVLPSQHRGAGV